MAWWGTVLGGTLGFMFGGPLGALIQRLRRSIVERGVDDGLANIADKYVDDPQDQPYPQAQGHDDRARQSLQKGRGVVSRTVPGLAAIGGAAAIDALDGFNSLGSYFSLYKDEYEKCLRQIADLFVLKDAARGEEVGVDDRDAAGLEQRPEILFQIDVFTSTDRRGN